MTTRLLIGAAIGAVLGFGWYKLVGCPTGACACTQKGVLPKTGPENAPVAQ